MHPAPASDDDLEECWRDLRPSRYHYTFFDLLRSAPAFVSVGTRDSEAATRLGSLLDSLPAQTIRVVASPYEEPIEALKTAITGERPLLGEKPTSKLWLARLLQAVRAKSRVCCRTIARHAAMGHLLEAIHDADIGPVGNSFDEDFVVDALWQWLVGHEHRWGDEEHDLFQIRPEEKATVPTDQPFVLQRRFLHLILVSGVYGLFDRVIIHYPDLDALVQRADLIQSTVRRARASQLDSLLEEIVHWNHHFSSCLTVVLGWSDQAENAVLLRGLCEPLMQKIETSKFWLP